jgi:hypothetical protein
MGWGPEGSLLWEIVGSERPDAYTVFSKPNPQDFWWTAGRARQWKLTDITWVDGQKFTAPIDQDMFFIAYNRHDYRALFETVHLSRWAKQQIRESAHDVVNVAIQSSLVEYADDAYFIHIVNSFCTTFVQVLFTLSGYVIAKWHRTAALDRPSLYDQARLYVVKIGLSPPPSTQTCTAAPAFPPAPLGISCKRYCGQHDHQIVRRPVDGRRLPHRPRSGLSPGCRRQGAAAHGPTRRDFTSPLPRESRGHAPAQGAGISPRIHGGSRSRALVAGIPVEAPRCSRRAPGRAKAARTQIAAAAQWVGLECR